MHVHIGPGPLPSPFFQGPVRVVGINSGPGGFFIALLLLVLVVGVVLLALSILLRRRAHYWHHYAGRGPWRSPGTSDAMRILNERFAKGDIDAEDYKTRKELLQERPPT